MPWNISWEEFQVYAAEFMTVSDEIGDDWEWKGDKGSFAGAYLTKRVIQPVVDTHGSISSSLEDTSLVHEERDVENFQANPPVTLVSIWDYHILYSASYGTPVLYFNVYTTDGQLQPLEVLWEGLGGGTYDSLRHLRLEALSQQEHPILRVPYFQLHPCRTADLLAPHKNHSANPFITWLSSIGPAVGLNLQHQYGRLVLK